MENFETLLKITYVLMNLGKITSKILGWTKIKKTGKGLKIEIIFPIGKK